MATKPNTPQSGAQAQAERPPVFGPLVAGVVVIKVFAAIKSEAAIGAPQLDWVAEDTQNGSAPAAAGHGLSVPPASELPANPGAGPLAYQADEASVGNDARDEEIRPPSTGSGHPQGRTGEDGFQAANNASAPVPMLDAPVAMRAAGESAGVPVSGGGAGADGANSTRAAPAEGGDEAAVPGGDNGQGGATEDVSEGGAPTPTAFSDPSGDGNEDTGDTRDEYAPADGPSAPVVLGDGPVSFLTGSWSDGLLLPGGGGDDTLIGGPGDDIIRGFGGDDTLNGRGGDDELCGKSGDDRLLGGDGDDLLEGGGGDDQLDGDAGDDDLDGGTGADHLFGLDGDDRLIGGLGRDELSGGRGADRFDFNDIAESFAENPDQLLDFRAYERDKLDVSGIDANSQTAQDEAFAFIEEDLFSGSAGELRFAESHGATYLYGDVNGDGEADFALELLGVSSLSVDDIIL